MVFSKITKRVRKKLYYSLETLTEQFQPMCLLRLAQNTLRNLIRDTKHPNYKYLSDADKRNEFDIERFLSRRLKPKPDEVYDVYDIDASVMDAGETAGG